MKNKTLWVAGLFCMAGLIAYKLIANKKLIEKKEQPVNTSNFRVPVTVAPVSVRMEQVQLNRTGMLMPLKEATIIIPVSGNIIRLLFKLGDYVKKGQVLAVVDTRLTALELQKAESTVIKLKNDLQIYTELLEGNATTQEKVNQLQQDYTDALNRVSQLKRQIADATIIAPISGTIETRNVEEGVFVSAGIEIATIVNLEKVKVNIRLTEQEVYTVQAGQEVSLSTDVYPEYTFTGTITFISPRASETNTYRVEITATNHTSKPLRAGTFVTANLSNKTKQEIILIPRNALTEGTENASVYVAVDGRAQLKKIVTGIVIGTQIQVLKGLMEGNTVITSGQINLHDGSLIKIINN